ncbi:MAG TPA: type II toxin-antitoxin system RelE/ParE family toxin, partial [Caldisericia bacterium]|nr:type II toxin-antitoxin system RelE/ParE family toxin [Caldisericia bacterium]
KDLIEEIKEVKSIKNIKNLKKLKIGKNYYRINIFDYRIGMILESDNLIFVRILNRKDIYKYFP